MENKKGSFKPIIIVMFASLILVWLWDKILIIKSTAHLILDPSVGTVLNWNLTYGMLIIVFLIGLIMTLVQKYTTDQKTLKEIKKEQKILQEEMKKYKDDPKKIMELQKKQFEFIPRTFLLTSRPIIYTGIPLILFFKWFSDYFAAFPDFKFFGILGWFWFYLIFTILFSTILRKVFDVH